MRRLHGSTLALGALATLSVACAAASPATDPAQPVPAAATPSDGAETLTGPPKVLPEYDVVGHWAQFWAPAGRADTQRYVFFADGRYGWAEAMTEGAATTVGRYRLEVSTLVLWAQPSAANSEPVAAQRLELDACPPNEEAYALDAGYRCLAIGDQAFFRRGDADATLERRFFPR